MEHTVFERYAKELYSVALNITGNDENARQISGDALVKAYESVASDINSYNTEPLKQLSIRLLYRYGKKYRNNRNCSSEVYKNNKLFRKLEKLGYNERFVILLFCCQKLQIQYISQVLRLPVFLVTGWLLSGAKKMALHNQTNSDIPEGRGFISHFVHSIM